MIRVEGLEKRFGRGAAALEGVSFTVKEGELVALLGPSGGGKSTVLRIIAGLDAPDRGAVYLNGVEATGKRVQERNIGFVFQQYALFRHMTVAENIAFGLEVRGRVRAEIDSAVANLLEMVKLDGLGGRYPTQLSGGQRQRVALARALAPKPKLLLLDEPFGALDAKVRVELREWIRKLHKEQGITSIFVTHDQEEAMDLADRVIVVNKGRIEQIGTPEEIYDHPATEFVASFVGSINLLRGMVSGGRAALGQVSVGAPGTDEGASVHAFVRPHEIELARPTAAEDASPAVATARIERMARVGGVVRIEVCLADGQPLTVELPKERVAELGLAEGDRVMVNVREAKLFVQDYAI